jgi:hypothetical protein
MSRLAGRYRWNPILAEDRHPRSTHAALRPGGRGSEDTDRSRAEGSRGWQVDADAGTQNGWMEERHDWLVPLGLT